VHVQRFLTALGLGHLLDQPKFADNAARMKNREALRALIDEKIGANSVEAWIGRLNRAGVPCGRVMDLAEVFADPQVQAQEMVVEIDHPGHGPVRMTGFPVKLAGTPARLRLPAPQLGEHTDEILRDLGYNAERIAGLKDRGIISVSRP
jgi:crotonobetainyl-CoA:carnitine CoA-transferase CaiB-like acyl-CoA transferase